jgi:diguanylate cyclase (GGDEF)-like protein
VKPVCRNDLDRYADVRTPIARMEAAPDITALARAAADDVRELSGFDRVMIYRFDEDWNGDVIAESTIETVPVSYLGLRFPAGDVPEQARRLYLLNRLRLVADACYVPALLVPQRTGAGDGPIDLSRAVLRSVSPVHLEYLANLNVRATLTISIVVAGRLWGLIACHHMQPRRVDYVTRASCEFFGQMLAWQIGSRSASEGLKDQLRIGALVAGFDRKLAASELLADGLLAQAQTLLELFAAQSLVVRVDGAFSRWGTTPADDPAVERIAAALLPLVENGVAASHAIETLVQGVSLSNGAAGALLIKLADHADEYLMCFRREVVENVDWAGDFRTAVTEYGGKLHPRISFALWKEVQRGRSERWSPHDIASAHRLRECIFERAQAIERRRAKEHIRFIAHHDSLTGLPNRIAFHDILRQLTAHAEANGETLSVFFVDVDHFKLFNDEFGHAAGDQILQAAATRMRESVRHTDVVARLGGDEFAIILPNVANEGDADAIASKILAKIAEPLRISEARDLSFTVSVGIAIYPRDASETGLLLQRADNAMYRAKERGRNSFQHFDGGMTGVAYERLTLERRIEEGLRNDEFVAYYQPIVEVKNGRLVAFEALARWAHPERGILAPSEFILIAEESGSIVTLGTVMLRAACATVADWRRRPGNEALYVSVNVSARQFREPGFLETVQQMLACEGLPVGAIQLELTESMLLADERAMEILRAFAAAGIGISIDDFGTGYSSLSYLIRMPVNVLKIDQSFVRNLNAGDGSSAIVRAIIAMARSLNMLVVAEGVETIEQLAILRTEGCDKVQGYFVDKPMSAQAAGSLIDRFKPLVGSGAEPGYGCNERG